MLAVLGRRAVIYGGIVLGRASFRGAANHSQGMFREVQQRFGMSFHARGRPKRELIRNDLSDDQDEEGNALTYDPDLADPSDEEFDASPNSLVHRLENKADEPALPILEKWIKDGKETPDGIVAAINRLKWLGRFKHALEISNFLMKERRLELQKYHYLNHLELLGRCHSMKIAEEFLKNMPRPYSKSAAAHLVMFENYVTHESLHNARLVLQVMKVQGYLTTPNEFNKLFALCAKRRESHRIPMLLTDMKELCISPNEETYEILIGIKASMGDKEGMMRLYEKMLADGDGTASASIRYMLASGYVKVGIFEEATRYLQEVVDDEEFRKSRKLHDKVIALYAAMGNVEEIGKVWRFSKRFAVISANSYIATIAAYEKVARVDKAEDVFLELERKKKSVLTVRHYNALFKMLSERNEMRKAEYYLKRMARSEIRMDNNTYHHLIAGYIKIGNQQMAVEVMKRLLEEHLKPSFETMLLVLQLHAENADVDSAEELFQNIKREGYSKSLEVYNTLLTAYVKAGKHAYRFLQRLAMEKLKPSQATNALLKKMKPIPKLSGPADGLALRSVQNPSPY